MIKRPLDVARRLYNCKSKRISKSHALQMMSLHHQTFPDSAFVDMKGTTFPTVLATEWSGNQVDTQQ